VQRHETAAGKAEEHARDLVARQVGADFLKPVAKRPAKRHADRPSELHAHEDLADLRAVLSALDSGASRGTLPPRRWFDRRRQELCGAGSFVPPHLLYMHHI
jgi:hypothetical protein